MSEWRMSSDFSSPAIEVSRKPDLLFLSNVEGGVVEACWREREAHCELYSSSILSSSLREDTLLPLSAFPPLKREEV